MSSSSITIKTNIASLFTQRRLGQSSSALQQSFTRLSSGLRINNSSDDAAGLAISESLKADVQRGQKGVISVCPRKWTDISARQGWRAQELKPKAEVPETTRSPRRAMRGRSLEFSQNCHGWQFWERY